MTTNEFIRKFTVPDQILTMNHILRYLYSSLFKGIPKKDKNFVIDDDSFAISFQEIKQNNSVEVTFSFVKYYDETEQPHLVKDVFDKEISGSVIISGFKPNTN